MPRITLVIGPSVLTHVILVFRGISPFFLLSHNIFSLCHCLGFEPHYVKLLPPPPILGSYVRRKPVTLLRRGFGGLSYFETVVELKSEDWRF